MNLGIIILSLIFIIWVIDGILYLRKICNKK